MKTRILKIFGVAVMATIGMVSCDTDPCKDVDCGNNGICVEGDCVCEDGFGGVDCATDYCEELVCDTTGGEKVATVGGCDCECNEGYEGDDCATLERAKFIGTYNVTEACTSGNFTYSLTITESSTGISAAIIGNFGDFNVNVTGTADGNILTIANQTVGGGTFQGSGQITGNILTITYTVTAGTSTDDCTMTCTKQ
jgi:hypothetical protein